MVEEQVDVEFLAADRRAILASHEGESDAGFKEELAQVVEQSALRIVLASIVLGAAHAYQGPTGILLTATLGLAFGIAYVASGRNLWFNIIVHGTYDTLSLALVVTNYDRVFNEIAHRIVPH